MKVSLVVIASLSVSPAYAFENLIIDSTFQYPAELTGKATNNVWTDVQLPNGPSVPGDFGLHGTGNQAQNQSSFAVPNLVAVPNLPNLFASPNLFAAPNPFVS